MQELYNKQYFSQQLMKRAGKGVLHGVLLSAICFPAAIFGNNVTNVAWAQGNTLARGDYRMGMDDVLEVVVRNYETYNRTVIIRPDGKISLPRAGEVQAAGLTATALAAAIQTKFIKTGLKRPYVTVTVKEVHSQRASVLGAVKTAGVYPIKPNWRIMDLVAVAGGLSAKPIRIVGRVIRAGQLIPFSVEQAALNPHGGDNIELRTDDLVYLEEQYIERLIHVVGQVTKPGAFDLEENLGVVELLARAGDATPLAALRKAHIIRGNQKIPLDLQAVLVEGEENEQVTGFKFQSGDVLVIPENTESYGVMGQVMSPRYYSMPDRASDATVVKALAAAGGPKPDGDLRQAAITRTVDGQVTVIPVNIDAILKGEAPDNISLRPNDTLNIPLARDQIHILGMVKTPGVYKLTDDTGPLSLISEAGSPVPGAALQRAYVLRGETQYPLNLHKVLTLGEPDPNVTGFDMAAGDILVIPENQLRFGVMGQVARPGYFPYPEKKEEASVLQALTLAGGPLPASSGRGGGEANLRSAFIIRMVGGKVTHIPIDLFELLRKNKNGVDNVILQPDDILLIPPKKKGFNIFEYLNPVNLLMGRFGG